MTQRPTPAPGELLTPAEAAAIVGVTPRTIHRYGSSGRIAFVALPSGHRRYYRESVESLCDRVAS